MTDSLDMREYPAWREALKQLLAAGFRPGDVITHEWMAEALGLERPQPNTPYAEAKKFTLDYLKARDPLRKALLIEHRILLVKQPGLGFRWVPPGEQTAEAVKEMDHQLKKALRTGCLRLAFLRLEDLTSEQRREHQEAQARLAFRQSALRERRPLLLPEAGQDSSD